MTRLSRTDITETTRQLRAILDAIERGDMDADPAMRARIEGAAVALETLTCGAAPGG